MPSNGYLSRDQILGFTGREYRDEEIPGWGKVCIQSLSDGELRALQAKSQDEYGLMDPEKAKYRFADRAIAQLVDPNTKDDGGSPLGMFGEGDRETLAAIKPALTKQLYSLMVAFEGGAEPEETDDDLKKSSEPTAISACCTD